MTLRPEVRVYRTGEVADLLGVHRQSLRRVERLGRTHRISREPGSDDRLFTEEDVKRLQEYFGRR